MAEFTLKELKDILDDNELDLSARGLTVVPKALSQLGRATEVDLGSNKIVTLPNEICTMTRLVRLELGSNQIVHLPDNFGLLVNLRHLNLYNNSLEDVPISFSNLRSLKWLDLKKNPLKPELQKAAGNCGNEKECREAAVRVVAHMSDMKRALENKIMKQEKVLRNIQANKSEQAKEIKNKKKNMKSKQDFVKNLQIKENEPTSSGNGRTVPAKNKKNSDEHYGTKIAKKSSYVVKMLSFILRWTLFLISCLIFFSTVSIFISCAQGGTDIARIKPLCSDLSKLSQFEKPSDRFLFNIHSSYSNVFVGYHSRMVTTVNTIINQWSRLWGDFTKSDIGWIINKYLYQIHTIFVDTILQLTRYAEELRAFIYQWWVHDGEKQLGEVIENIRFVSAILYEMGKDASFFFIEAIQSLYNRLDQFIVVWVDQGFHKALQTIIYLN